MEPKPTGNIFAAVHTRIAAMKDKMRADQFAASGVRERDARQEAAEKAVDHSPENLPAPDDESKLTQ